MPDQDERFLLLEYLFCDAAEAACRAASPRMLRWCRAFQDWLAMVAREQSAGVLRSKKRVWRLFLGHCRKPPWEVSRQDVEDYRDWRRAQGRTARTVELELCSLGGFYRWAGARRVDGPWGGSGFDPLETVAKGAPPRYSTVTVLSPAEAHTLLESFRLEGSPLSLRDYAFVLARLRLGVPLKDLQRLRWGQIEAAEDGVWLCWELGRQRLDEEVYAAILHYLRAAGRLETIRAGAYVFAPLALHNAHELRGLPGEWDDRRFIDARTIRKHLKRFGRAAGIPPHRLTPRALRHTAALLRVEAGDSPQEIMDFMGRKTIVETRCYVRALRALAAELGGQAASPDSALLPAPALFPARQTRLFAPGQTMTHGLSAKSQPPDELAAMLAEGLCGLGDEMDALRLLERRLLEMQAQVGSSGELARLLEMTTRLASRMAELRKTQDELAQAPAQGAGGREAFVAELLELGIVAAGQADLALDDPDAGAAVGGLAEEIAAVRLVLRRAFHLAMATQDVRELAQLAHVYDQGCMRLARLLRAEIKLGDDFREQLKAALRQATLELLHERGWE